MAHNYDNVAEEYRPLSPWTYFWVQILYAIPVIGFIFLIIHAIGAKNVNKKNFARSYFCVVIIAGIVLAITFAIGGAAAIGEMFSKIGGGSGTGA